MLKLYFLQFNVLNLFSQKYVIFSYNIVIGFRCFCSTMFSHQTEEIVYPKLTEGSEQDDGPKPIDRNEEFLRHMMEQMDDEALETD